jgi:hypothetical protein
MLSRGAENEEIHIGRDNRDTEARRMGTGQDNRGPSPVQTPEEKGTVTVLRPRKDIPIKTVKSIFKQAGL